VKVQENFHTAAMLFYTLQKDLNRCWSLGYLQCYNIHTNFCENQSTGSKF